MLIRLKEGRRAGEVVEMPAQFANPLLKQNRATRVVQAVDGDVTTFVDAEPDEEKPRQKKKG